MDVLKKDQKNFGLRGRLLLREAKKFSRFSPISLFEVRGRFLYFSNRAMEFLRRTFRRMVSFFLISEIIAGVYPGWIVFSFHDLSENLKSMFIKLRLISSKFVCL